MGEHEILVVEFTDGTVFRLTITSLGCLIWLALIAGAVAWVVW